MKGISGRVINIQSQAFAERVHTRARKTIVMNIVDNLSDRVSDSGGPNDTPSHYDCMVQTGFKRKRAFCEKGNDPARISSTKRRMDPKVPKNKAQVFFQEGPITPGLLDGKNVSSPKLFFKEFDFSFHFLEI